MTDDRPGLRPRVLVIGAARLPLGASGEGLTQELRDRIDLRTVDARAPLLHAPRMLRQASRLIRAGGVESVHLLDARFAPAVRLLRAGLPTTATVTALDAGCSPLARLSARALRTCDELFVPADDLAAVRSRVPATRVTAVPPAAGPLPWPSRRALNRVGEALRGVLPGRLVVAAPWPRGRADLCWLRDIVVPQAAGQPVFLLFGAPGRRPARLALGPARAGADVRIAGGRADVDSIAAISRHADAFVLPGSRDADDGALALALAMGGLPVIARGADATPVFAHERNAFVVDHGSDQEFVAALNQVLALPAVQRHFLGEDFARYTLRRWPWSDVAEVYAERFAAIVGRPRIPAELRAA